MVDYQQYHTTKKKMYCYGGSLLRLQKRVRFSNKSHENVCTMWTRTNRKKDTCQCRSKETTQQEEITRVDAPDLLTLKTPSRVFKNSLSNKTINLVCFCFLFFLSIEMCIIRKFLLLFQKKNKPFVFLFIYRNCSMSLVFVLFVVVSRY